MRSADLLIAAPSVTSLDAFAALVFQVLEVESFEERESSHYIDGVYFKARHHGRDYQVMRRDDEDHRDLPYWVGIDCVSADDAIESAEIDALARQLMTTHGCKVARLFDFGWLSERRVDYCI